jgi:hypothetical protein
MGHAGRRIVAESGGVVSILSLLLLLTLASIGGAVVCLRQPNLKHQNALSYAFALAATVLLAFPLSIAATFAATPFWSWLGSLLGVRLVGRAGPPMICHVGVLIVFTTLLGACSILVVRRALQRRTTK